MIRATDAPRPSVAQTVARLKAWLGSIDHKTRIQVATEAEIDEKTLRLALYPKWNPRAATLHKLEQVIPADFKESKAKKAVRA